MAIAGVGSFADSLADGLAREGRVILGGDVAFSLIHREASPQERAFLAQPRPGLGRRHHARHGARRRRTRERWSRSRRSTAPIRFTARPRSMPRTIWPRRVRRARRRLRRGRRPGAAGAARSRAGRASRRRQRQVEIRAVAESRARQARRRHRLRSAPADERSGAARDRAAAAGQPGALALPGASLPGQRRRPTARPSAWSTRRGRSCPMPAGRSARATNASPQLERNIERFTAISHAGRADGAAGRRRRRRQCGARAISTASAT